MAYRQRGEGSFTHLVPQDCRTCKKSKNCKLKNLAGSHCSMRDRVERWVYQYYVRDIANKPVRKSISAKTRKLLLAKVNNLKEKPQETVGTLGAWLDVWLEKVIKGSVKTSTYAYYKYMLKYVPEYLAKVIDDPKKYQKAWIGVCAATTLFDQLAFGMLLQSYWLSLLYGSPYTGMMASRVLQIAILIPVEFVVLIFLPRLTDKLLPFLQSGKKGR